MRISRRALNRSTVRRQLLSRRHDAEIGDALGHLVGLQAQNPASPYLALWSRLADFDPSRLDDAFASAAVIRATALRITIHAVRAEDYRLFHAAMQPSLRGAGLGDRRFTDSGLTPADADATAVGLLEFARRPRTVAELTEWIEAHAGVPSKGIWRAFRCYAPLRRVPGSGPWSFDSTATYQAVDSRPTPTDGAEEALSQLLRRYLAAFGPASLSDMSQFANVRMSRLKQLPVDDLTRLEGPEGQVLFDLPGGAETDVDSPLPPRLLPMWDNLLLAYADRSRVLPEEYRRLIVRINGDVLPTLLVDGHVAGVWRPCEAGIEATAFHRLSEIVWEQLAAEAADLHRLLRDREVGVYSRHRHWWDKLPAGQTRILPGRE